MSTLKKIVLALVVLFVAGGATKLAIDKLAADENARDDRARSASVEAHRAIEELQHQATRQPPPKVDPAAEQAKEKARYERDRDALRKAHPQTEDQLVSLTGRKPDNIMEMPQYTILQWYYETKNVGRDVIQATLQQGKVTMMSY